jgi:hypothetical protein
MYASQASFADESEMVCRIKTPIEPEDLRKHISEEGCKKGDVLIIYDTRGPWLRYKTFAQVCDLERPFTGSADTGFVCHYQGFIRQNRN